MSGRKKSGLGNVIRTHICIQGLLAQDEIENKFQKNIAINFLAPISPSKKWYSTKYFWKEDKDRKNSLSINFYQAKTIEPLFSELLTRDCDFKKYGAIHLDVIYEAEQKTHLILSVNHCLLDYHGMELMLQNISTGEGELHFSTSLSGPQNNFSRFLKTIQASLFLAGRSGWNIQGLKKNSLASVPAFHSIKINKEDWLPNRNAEKHKGLPLYLASSVHALSRQNSILRGSRQAFFIPSPVSTRNADTRNVLLSNNLSFLFYRIDPRQISSVEDLRSILLKQTIEQAKLKIPEKFVSLMDAFSYLPEFIYKAFINLPSRGRTSTFAFSLLPGSFLDKGFFLGHEVLDFTHFPPFLSPPGLNIVFMEENENIKIVLSYDQNRLSKESVILLLKDIKANLINH
jgi:hypothetical protein